ncbi:hypothetical protein [Kribbella shirazensis]|uniref:DUF1877 family protein n=1 Tax=Kribbella shirazensis TaxID=1105143 RepID=A0A7X5VAN7_9ACTN|nr:hypothetical protein [Kribbella shirazensis]NIK56933.1 hypothetical protein [Kribbella shirazensis]
MGVLFDYFAADSDEQAASAIDRVGGPGTADPDASAQAFDTVSVKGIDPVVQMGTLEALLTGRPYDASAVGQPLAIRDGGERVVLALADSLTIALAEACPERLAEVAVPWSRTEEFWGSADPDTLTEILRDLAGLAGRAQAASQRLYCWISV